MRFSVHEVSQAPDGRPPERVLRETIELAKRADELGYERFWLAEHHFTHYGVVGSPLLLAAAIAAATERIRIGMAVLVLPFYDPVRLAEECATVDVLSGGRLDIGYGRGYQPVEFAGFRIDQSEARSRAYEALEIMTRAWTQERFSFEGEHFTIPELSVFPRPVQQPHPPLFQATVSVETFRMAGLQGTAILTSPNFTPLELIAEQFQAYAGGLRESGHDPADFDFPVMQQVYVGDSEEDARGTPEPHTMWFYRELGSLVTGAGSAKKIPRGYESWKKISERIATITYDEVFERGVFGTAEDVVERVRRLRDVAGVNHFTLWPNFGGIDFDLAVRTLERFAAEVIPVLQQDEEERAA